LRHEVSLAEARMMMTIQVMNFARSQGLNNLEPTDIQDQATTIDQKRNSNQELTIKPVGPKSRVEALIELGNLSLHPLSHGIIEIGRSEDSQIRITDPVVSRRHAQILVYEGCLILFDLDSTNGTYVNGKRVDGGSILFGGDKISIGLSEFIVAA
jgi:pSer/pThr/pTyr-binding forkhead associated (FHA) protein